MRDDALRQVVRFDLVRYGELLELGHEAPVPADDAFDQSGLTEAVESAVFAVTLSRGVHQREMAGFAGRLRMFLLGVYVEVFDRNCEAFGETDADEAAGCDRIPVMNEADRVQGGDDLSPVRIADRVEQWMRVDIDRRPSAERCLFRRCA